MSPLRKAYFETEKARTPSYFCGGFVKVQVQGRYVLTPSSSWQPVLEQFGV